MTTSPVNHAESFPCAGCGYDLRGLPLESRCPECTLPIRQSRAIARANWTLVKGLRRALLHLSIAVPASAAIVFAVLCVFRTPLNWLASNAAPLRASMAGALLSLPFAAPLVWLLWHRLRCAAGFDSLLLVAMALLAAAAALCIAALAAIFLAGVVASSASTVTVAIMFGVVLWVVYSYLTD